MGWQAQKKGPGKDAGKGSLTLQEAIESALSSILQENVKLISSGRTDSGAHALEQTANFKTKSLIKLKKLRLGLNCLLPEDIRIRIIRQADNSFHSRFDAKTKVYQYRIITGEFVPVFLRNYVHHVRTVLNVGLMRREAKTLLGRHDFKSFQAADKNKRSSIREVKRIIIRKSGKLIILEIEANGFLYNMVRNIAGTLIEIGRGRFSEGSMRKILSAKNRGCAGRTAPAKGLFLVKVKY